MLAQGEQQEVSGATIDTSHQYEVDEYGIPQLPNELKKYFDWRFSSARNAKYTMYSAFLEALDVYKIWKSNRYYTVQVDTNNYVPECYSDPDIFYSESPDEPEGYEDWKSYQSERGNDPSRYDEVYLEYLREYSRRAVIDFARAKKACWHCPVRTQCLAASLTLRSPRGIVETDEFGVWGGYGKGARNTIHTYLMYIWELDKLLQEDDDELDLDSPKEAVLLLKNCYPDSSSLKKISWPSEEYETSKVNSEDDLAQSGRESEMAHC